MKLPNKITANNAGWPSQFRFAVHVISPASVGSSDRRIDHELRPRTLMKTQVHTAPLISILALAIMGSAFPGCSTVKQPSKTATKAAVRSKPEKFTERIVIGEWTIAVEPTADVLARAQFGIQQTITIKAGATHPETNTVTKSFSQKEYDEAKTLWIEALKKPDMQWRLVLKPDHTGQHIAQDRESNKPHIHAVQWELLGAELRLVYPEEGRFNTFTSRLVSSHELHYPMQPLGGWFVMRRQ